MKKQNLFTSSTIIAACIILVFLFSKTAVSAPDDSPQDIINTAWELAHESGSYAYQTAVSQTIYPAPSLTNVGRQPEEETIALQGTVDLPADLMEMTIWQNGVPEPETGLSVRIENGEAYGRYGENEWQPIDNIANLFAPNQDPLGFLGSITNIQSLGTETRELGIETLTYSRYSFDLDSHAYADQMQIQLEEHLLESGPLPAGIRLNTAEMYREAAGQGEIWLDEAGHPARFTMQLTLPPHGDSGKTVAEIQTDFFDFDETAVTTPSPINWLTTQLSASETQQAFSINVLLIFLLVTILLIAFRFRYARQFYAVLVVLITTSMLLTPLLQAQQLYAFHQRVGAEAQAISESEIGAITTQPYQQPEWNPQQNPLESVSSESYSVISEQSPNLPISQSPNASLLQTSTTDSDNDGIDDATETAIGTNPAAADTDGDGLTDGEEYYTIGIDPTTDDHDGDGIMDLDEVTGFQYNGKTWYLNAGEADSNKDSLIDSIECPVRSLMAESYDGTAVCPDTDSDGTPDPFDSDNDNDGIHDAVDLSPFSVSGIFNRVNPFQLAIDNLATDRPVFVTVQMRPTDEKHLTYFGNVLDWPTGDDAGQIQRHLDTTFATTALADIRSNSAAAALGDIRLVPVMEMFIPYSDGHYANLPVLDTAPATRTADLPLDQWLDTSQLELYGISVHQADETSGDLVAYIPLNLVEDETGGGLDAFSAQLLYWPSQADWGSSQQMRLLWLVQKIKDECVTTNDDGSCAAYEDTGIEVIHIYQEDWQLTGLEVREDHGMALAMVAEDPTVDVDTSTDETLWHLATNLSLTFSEGVDCIPPEGSQSCTRDDNRDMTAADIYTHFNHSTNGTDPLVTDWNLQDSLTVNYATYPHSGFVAQVAMTDTVQFLDNVFGSVATQVNPTVLFAREETFRALNLDNGEIIGNELSVDITAVSPHTQTMGTLNWTPYAYQGGSWQNYEIASYLDYLQLILSNHAEFQPADSNEDALALADGQLFAAQLYYLSLYNGLTAQVEINGLPIEADPDTNSQYAVNLLYETGFLKPLKEMARLTLFMTAASYTKFPTTTEKSVFTALSHIKNGGIQNYFRSKIWNRALSPSTTKNYNMFTAFPQGKIGKGGALLAGTAVAGLAFAGAMQNWSCSSALECDALQNVFAGLTGAMVSVQTVNMVNKMVRGYQNAVTLGVDVFDHVKQVVKESKVFGKVGTILSVITIWSLFAATGGGYAAGATAIAATIAEVLLFVISLIPVIGQILVLLITLVDILSFLICEAFGLSGRGCNGIVGNITAVLADWFYDIDYIIDLENPDRLDIAYHSLTLADEDGGYTTANTLQVTMAVTSTILDEGLLTYQSIAGPGIPITIDRVSDYRQATFIYQMQTAETDLHNGLNLNQMRDAWQVAVNRTETSGGSTITYGDIYVTEYPTATINFADIGAGLNKSLDPLYLTEAFAAPYEECITVIFSFCDWESVDHSSHFEVGESLVFDILPATLDDFYDLVSVNGGYALSWAQTDDLRFPRLADADGDGLLNTKDGGTDRNDNSWDTDGDGLSDYYELTHFTSPLAADTDGDGWDDPTELYQGTDPREDDADGDGLRDKDELAGWPIRYRVAGDGTYLFTKVWSDPAVSDADSDGLNDYQEFILGLHPSITDDVDIQEALTFSQSSLDELNTPLLLTRFEEQQAQNVLFADVSGVDNDLFCLDDTCPTYGDLGRYGNGLDFDGVDDSLDANKPLLDLSNGDFSIGLWVKTSGRGEGILTKNGDSGVWETGVRSLYISSGGRVQFSGFGNGSINGSDLIADNQWHHVMVTWDASSETAVLYIDGIADTSATSNYTANESDNATHTIKIGAPDNSNSAKSFSGQMDELIVFDNALSATEVAAVMNGHYNTNDLRLQPGANLAHTVIVSNTLSANHVGVTLSSAADAPLTLDTTPRTFTVTAGMSNTLNNSVQIPGSTISGTYHVETIAEGAVVSSDESATFRTFPQPNADFNFERNEWSREEPGWHEWRADEAVAWCRYDPNSSALQIPLCPVLNDVGIHGRSEVFDGIDDHLQMYGETLSLEGTPLTVAGWISPTHSSTDTEKRGIFGYFEPQAGWYRFEESAGATTFTDAMGNRPLTCTNCPTAGENGRFNSAITFNNTDFLSRTVDNSEFFGGQVFNILFWFQRSSTNAQEQTLVNLSDGEYRLYIGLTADHRLHVLTQTFNGTEQHYYSTNTFANTDWHQAVLSVDDYGVNLWVDGLEEIDFVSGTRIHPDPYYFYNNDGSSPTILTVSDPTTPFQGALDELLVQTETGTYQDLLSSADLYQHGFRVFPSLYVQGETLGFWAMAQGHDSEIEATTTGINLNEWNHVAFTYDGTNSYALYLNGVQLQFFTDDPLYMPVTNILDQRARIGWIGGDFGYFAGGIDALKIYQQALTSNEITSLATSTFNENVAILVDYEEVPSTTEFQYEFFVGDAATCSGTSCPIVGARGIVNRAAYFDGNDQISIRRPNDPSGSTALGTWNGLSISTWVKTDSSGTLVDYDDGFGDDGYTLTTELFKIDATQNTFDHEFVLSYSGLPVNEWAHLVATWDYGTGLNGTMKMYINGVEVASRSVNGFYSLDQYADRIISVGSSVEGASNFSGYMDETRIYPMPLSASDVLNLYTQSAPALKLEFDEDEGATILDDASPNDTDGTPVNATIGLPGRIGNSVAFTGTSAVAVSSAPFLDSLDDTLTLMAWVRPDDLSGEQIIVSHGRTNDNDGVALGLNGNSLRFIAYGQGTELFESSAATLVPNQWQHVAVVLDRLQNAYFYVNGELQEVVSTGISPAANDDGDVFYVGATTDVGTAVFTQPFRGLIDEVTVYNRQLSGLEIEDFYWLEWRWFRERGDYTITVDTDAPTIELLSDYEYRPLSYVILGVQTADSLTDIRFMEMGLKRPNASSFTWTAVPLCQDDQSGTLWCPGFDPFTEGAHELQFRAVDSVGLETTSEVYTFYVDGTAVSLPTAYNGEQLPVTHLADSEEWTVSLSGQVSDPALGFGGADGSGVDPSSLIVSLNTVGPLFKPEGLPSGSTSSLTSFDGSNWTLTYTFYDFAPTGEYQVWISGADNVGNSITTHVGKIMLDGQSPLARLDSWAASDVISDTNSLFTGLAVEQPDWGGTRAEYHFEGQNGDTRFYDSSNHGNHSEVCSSCPAVVPGLFGSSADYSEGDMLTIPADESLNMGQEFSIAFWINPDNAADGTPDRFVTLGDDKIMFWNNGGELFFTVTLDGTTHTINAIEALIENYWNHVVATYDGTTMKLYNDGFLLKTLDATGQLDNSQTLTIGDSSDTFDGQLDQVMLYNRVLSQDEIHNMAERNVQGVQTVDVWLEPIDIGTPPTDLGWQSAYFSGSTWQYDIGTGHEWYYDLHLRSSDNQANDDEEGVVWRGIIDQSPPQILTYYAQHIGSGNSAQTEYTFTFTDFALDENNLSHPCAASDLTATMHDNSTDTLFATLPHEISGICRVAGHESEPVTITACDLAGHCTSETTSYFEPVFRILDSSTAETDSTSVISFTVQLTAPMTQTVSVDYHTVDDTAVSHLHYTPVTGTLTFDPGETSQFITVPVLGDDEFNEDRTFTVHLSNAGLTAIADNVATGTIVNDDLAVVFLPVVMNNYAAAPDLIVDELTVSGNEIEVVIKNVGDTAVTDEFWVDVYIDPSTPPTAVNQTIATLNSDGAVWGVTASTLPLLPGDSLTLTLHDTYFEAGMSRLSLPVGVNTAVYAQVDSAHANSSYGGVLENHERTNSTYNNILKDVSR